MTQDDRFSKAAWQALRQRNGLLIRLVSAVALGSLVIAAIVFDGWPHLLLWCIAAIGVFWEWCDIVAPDRQSARIAGMGALTIAGSLVGTGYIGAALIVIVAGMAVVGGSSMPGRRLWGTAGLAYAAPVLIGPIVLRADPQFGILALIFLCAVVWTTDTSAYFAGRLCGGPKLAPMVSPKKTWSGACGGAIGGTGAGLAVAAYGGLPNLLAVVCLALLLSLASQAGDLLESAVKRRFGVKDSSHVIPGHGGLMDRLDGFLAAAGVAAMIGFSRGGIEHAARGLLQW